MKVASLLLSTTLSACAASGPAYVDSGLATERTPAGQARIVFFRTKDSRLYMARTASISIDGSRVGGTAYGTFHHHAVDPGPHTLRAGMWDAPGVCEVSLTVEAGETRYFQVDARRESFGAFAAADFVMALVTGSPAIGVTGGVGAMALESYGERCGGAFRLYPVDDATAKARLGPLRQRR